LHEHFQEVLSYSLIFAKIFVHICNNFQENQKKISALLRQTFTIFNIFGENMRSCFFPHFKVNLFHLMFFHLCLKHKEKYNIYCFSRNVGLSANEILDNLETAKQDPSGGYDIILFPPEDEVVTDEDSDDEDEVTGNPNRRGKGILSQQAELVVTEHDDELPDMETVR
jgi:hypothetical protein